MKKLTLGLMMSLLLMAIPAAVMAQDRAVPQVISGETIPCPMPLAPGDVDGETVICGQIQVPEDWDDPNSDPITITYARLLSSSLSPLQDPIFFSHGGPGGSVLASQGSSNFDFNYLRETRDVVVWDQRGNRYSADLRCPVDVVDADYEAAGALAPQLNSFTVESDPQALYDYAEAYTFDAMGYGNCPAYFAEQGIDVSEYSTNNTVLDAIALMRHLGDPIYNLFGISYGTTVTMAILDYYQNNPDADLPVVRSVLIDGIAPLAQVSAADGSLTTARNIMRIFADCEADEACGAAYLNSQQTLIDLLDTLEEGPVTDAEGNKVPLEAVVLFLTKAVTGRSDLVAYMPRMVDELSRGETATMQVVANLIGQGAPPPAAPATPATNNPLDVLTSRAASLASELRGLAEDVSALGQSSGDLAAAIDQAETVPELYLLLLESALEDAHPDERAVFAVLIAQNIEGQPENHTRENLEELSKTFPDPTGAELLSIVNLLSDEEVAGVFADISAGGEYSRLNSVEDMTNFVVRCNTPRQRSSSDVATGLEQLSAFPAPQLISPASLLPFANVAVACDLFGIGTPAVTDEEPVILDVAPTLILNGGLDHATPVEWGEVALELFAPGSARMLTVPMTDHGVTRYSKCAKDIAHAFFLNPEMELRTDCINAFAPDYVLPDDALPGATAATLPAILANVTVDAQ
jgi:pimeloyl-ACP methyl ester carboxylesterase